MRVGGNYETTDSSYVEVDHYNGSKALIDWRENSRYELYDLWEVSEDYSIRFPTENDFYYAKIRAFRENIFWTLGRQILLAPQNTADINAPEITLASTIEIPVYQEQIVDFRDYIYEDGGGENIASLTIDLDLEEDADNDGNPKNDDMLDSGSVYIQDGKIEVTFGPYDSLFEKDIWITVKDTAGNKGYREVGLRVYAPIPKIQKYESWILSGIIEADLDDEPISFYRLRWNLLTRLEDKNGGLVANTSNGSYSFETVSGSEWLVLMKDAITLAQIREDTGKIDITWFFPTSIKVLSSNERENDGSHPKIILRYDGDDIYYESLHVSWNESVGLVESFSEVGEAWVYVSFSDKVHYNYYTIPTDSEYSGGSVSIYRNTLSSKQALFTIFPDGRVHTLNDFYDMEYESFWDYVVYRLMDRHFNREVARVLVKIEGEYVVR